MRAFIREIIETVILSLMLFVGIQFMTQSFQVEGASMRPTLGHGDYLLVNKMAYRHVRLSGGELAGGVFFPFQEPRAGDVVVFKFPDNPERDFVKRLIGGPGDRIEIREGTVFVNGRVLDEPYVLPDELDFMDERVVEPNTYFVMGDNRANSADSRSWGSVPLENMVGVAWLRYWPLGEIGFLPGDGGGEGAAAAE